MTPDDIKYAIHEDIVMHEYEPAVVRTRVEAFLAGLRDTEETAASVYDEAREIAYACHREFVMRDGDMERVVAIFDAVLDPMIHWLETNGLLHSIRRPSSAGRAHPAKM